VGLIDPFSFLVTCVAGWMNFEAVLYDSQDVAVDRRRCHVLLECRRSETAATVHFVLSEQYCGAIQNRPSFCKRCWISSIRCSPARSVAALVCTEYFPSTRP